MDLQAFRQTPARKNEVVQIACDQCWCSHVCFIHDSLRHSRKALLAKVPKSFALKNVW